MILQKQTREPQKPDESYDGPENSKQVNLTGKNEEPRQLWIALELVEDEEKLLIETLKSYKDVFAWDYSQVKGIDASLHQNKINLKEDTVFIVL